MQSTSEQSLEQPFEKPHSTDNEGVKPVDHEASAEFAPLVSPRESIDSSVPKLLELISKMREEHSRDMKEASVSNSKHHTRSIVMALNVQRTELEDAKKAALGAQRAQFEQAMAAQRAQLEQAMTAQRAQFEHAIEVQRAQFRCAISAQRGKYERLMDSALTEQRSGHNRALANIRDIVQEMEQIVTDDSRKRARTEQSDDIPNAAAFLLSLRRGE